MKTVALLLIVLALVAGGVPQFTDCQSQDKAILLPTGNTVPMKCHWTARAEIAVAAPLLAAAILLLFARQRENRRGIALMSIGLGLMILLLPTVLIGVCAKSDMLCHAVMKPVLILAGILVMALGTLCLILNNRDGVERR